MPLPLPLPQHVQDRVGPAVEVARTAPTDALTVTMLLLYGCTYEYQETRAAYTVVAHRSPCGEWMTWAVDAAHRLGCSVPRRALSVFWRRAAAGTGLPRHLGRGTYRVTARYRNGAAA